MNRVGIRRTEHRLEHDIRRVIAKPYLPGEEIVPGGDSRSSVLMGRILAIPEAEVDALLGSILANFSTRHRSFEQLLERHFALVSHHAGPASLNLSRARKLLIGAFYTHEYSIEGAALFNPSMVWAPNQAGLAPGEGRVVMSVRAVGEGHISSIEFRTGVIGGGSALRFDPPGTKLVTGQREAPRFYDKHLFGLKLAELGAANEVSQRVLDELPEPFTRLELERAIEHLGAAGAPHSITFETVRAMHVLAASNYVTRFSPESELSERVLFPAGPQETHGMEDARFVRFVESDGRAKYYATYTAYDGFEILPQLIETEDFLTFHIATLNGNAAQNKGMALFPRRIRGKYVMLSRKDRENLYLVASDNVRFWNDPIELEKPRDPWELLQIGNCGSPIETEAGWLVLTHGVGAMRRYAIGVLLLDLEDPSKVLGRLPYPLIEPNEAEREGYVPNVVYSCGALVRERDLVIPYGLSDGAVGIAIVSLNELLAALKDHSSAA